MNLDVGSVVGDYQIIGVLGAGGMGKVFKVRNTISERIEAMKVLLPDLSGEADLADRFLREIKVQASLDHPNIAGLRTAMRFENQLLMVMELVEGVSLDERLRKGPMPVGEAVRCIDQILCALAYAHSHDVIHRDIKPANMMLTPDGTVKLMDFGIAKAAADHRLTMTGTTMGSLYYMSPEQIRGSQTLDARSDLYSVGVSLYELVTGKRPFDGDSQFAIMSAHLEKTPVPPIALDPSLPPGLNDLILVAVSREPEARFQTAEAFRNALSSIMSRPATAEAPVLEAVTAAATGGVAPGKRTHRALWVAVGAVCCLVVLVAAIEFGPKKKAAADSVAPVPTPTAPAVTAPPVTTAPESGASPVLAGPPAGEVARPPAEKLMRSPGEKGLRRPVSPLATPVERAPAPPVPVPAVSGSQASVPAVAPPVQAPPQPDLSAQRAELQKLRESEAMLAARAGSIRSTLQNLQRSQAASGLGLRGDWLQAANLMDSFLKGSSDALAANDASSAKGLMDKAEAQIEKLEKALNK
jgi:eukaryotic-like serine/threonine-protein kinase